MDVQSVKNSIIQDFQSSADQAALNAAKAKYLGKNGVITGLFASFKTVADPVEKKEKGRIANELKIFAEERLAQREREFLNAKKLEAMKDIDETLPAYAIAGGSVHPLTMVMREINEIFLRMGFSIEEGPEIEKAEYNFKMLNFPEEHPAMDMHDTFHLDDKHLLRTHTSPIQIRAMLKHKPPLKIIAPGRVYRRDAVDATHSPVFHQVEGFMVDEGIRFSDLKGILNIFVGQVFGKSLKTRFRPSFFPFTEPSAEVDVQCFKCMGKGCPTCKKSGWIEIMGCGMIHPNVLKAVSIDPEKYTGFAFGMGVERIAMLKYSVTDMRLFFENDVRFLKQF